MIDHTTLQFQCSCIFQSTSMPWQMCYRMQNCAISPAAGQHACSLAHSILFIFATIALTSLQAARAASLGCVASLLLCKQLLLGCLVSLATIAGMRWHHTFSELGGQCSLRRHLQMAEHT